MASTFEIAARAAIEEMITRHAQPSKFGYILTKESARELTSELFELFQTSRNLKTAGDRMLGGTAATRPGASSAIKRNVR